MVVEAYLILLRVRVFQFIIFLCQFKGFNGGIHIGCLRDNGNNRILVGSVSRFLTDNSPQRCIGHCFSTGYLLAGVQYINECYCGHNLTTSSPLEANSCNYACPGDPSINCGGDYTMNVYHTLYGNAYMYTCTHTLLLISSRPAEEINTLLNTSSQFPDQPHLFPNQSILDSSSDKSSNAWCSSVNDKNQWIQMNLKRRRVVTGIITRGRNISELSQWVKSYKIAFSDDGNYFQVYTINGTEVVFNGNNDKNTKVRNYFAKLNPHQDQRQSVLAAKYIRLIPQTWNGHICLRWDIIGCRDDNPICPIPKYEALKLNVSDVTRRIQVSSYWGHQYRKEFSVLDYPAWSVSWNSSGGWCAGGGERHWIEMDLLFPTLVIGVITQGLNNSLLGGGSTFVTAFKIEYALTRGVYRTYSLDDKEVEFGGNSDQNTKKINIFLKPFVATFVRLTITAHTDIHPCLRWDVLTCEADPGCQNRYKLIVPITENHQSKCELIFHPERATLIQCRSLACHFNADIFNLKPNIDCVIRHCAGKDKKIILTNREHQSDIYSAED